MSEELRQEYTTIPQAAMSWKKLWAIFYYTYQLQQDHFPGDISLIIIILVCQHKMNILWKKIDKLFPKHENDRKIIHQINTGVPGSRCSSNQILEISKVEMNQSMSELEDSVIALKQELMHYTITNCYEVVFEALKILKDKWFIYQNWNILWKNRIFMTKDKNFKRKWRIFKNNCNIIFHTKAMFTEDQRRVTDRFQRLSSLTPTKHPDSDCCQ